MPPETATPPFLQSFSPFSGAPLGAVRATSPHQVQGIVDAVVDVQPFWAALPLSERARYMRRAAQLIIDETDAIRDLIAAEQGKPRNEAYLMEVLPTIDSLHWIAEHGPGILGEEKVGTPQVFFKTKRASFTYEPLGVVGVIAPWNYPWSIPFGEVAIALMCGNGVVLKPAPLTCLIGERIGEIWARAGVPEGLVRVIHGDAETGNALVESGVAKVFFTGSVEVGRGVGEACARRLKGSVLELGGKDPMLVLDDAPLEHAIGGALWGGFANAGQTCSGIERVYVAREVAERFVAGVVAGARRLRVGDPLEWSTELGPMVSREQRDIVVELVDDAIASGAKLECGGPITVDGSPGAFYAPAVLTGVTHEMRIMREEIFGPVLPIVTMGSDAEAVELANDSRFGLGASVWTEDRARGSRIARELEAGMVWINTHMYSHGACQCVWGGVKDSGLGRSHSKFGFYECVNIKQNVWEPSWTRDPWWHPYDETLGRAMSAAATALYGREAQRLGALRRGALPLLKVGRRALRGRS